MLADTGTARLNESIFPNVQPCQKLYNGLNNVATIHYKESGLLAATLIPQAERDVQTEA